jgi:hypothetical protein
VATVSSTRTEIADTSDARAALIRVSGQVSLVDHAA